MPPKKDAAPATHLRFAIGTFKLPNGDEYSGNFQANANTKFITRHGSGTYTTWDGQRYTGMWENDALVAKSEPATIQYADNSVYTGLLSMQMEYTGNGSYQFYDGSRIAGTFAKNVPTEGDLVFTDPRGAIWSHKIANEFLVIRHPNWFALEVVAATAAALASQQADDKAP